jgi:hypothetical protein
LGIKAVTDRIEEKANIALAVAPQWRQNYLMSSVISIERARQNLRLETETWEQIDAQRAKRPGNVSRNTWITEAIREKLERDAPHELTVRESKHA